MWLFVVSTMFNGGRGRTRYRDESVVTKWDQLKQLEDSTDQLGHNHHQLGHNHHHQLGHHHQLDHQRPLPGGSVGAGDRVASTFKQLRESGARTYSSIKNTVTDLYR